MTCRLYLVTPPDLARPGTAGGRPLDAFAQALSAALEGGDVACLVLLGAGAQDDDLAAAVARLRPLAQGRGTAFLLHDRFELAAETGCDGVHLGAPEAYPDARRRLGEDAIVGVGCAASRHDAMVAGERAADYVAFGALEPDPAPADPRLLSWWQELMIVPCVALGGTTPEACAGLAEAGADFVAVGTPVWDDPRGPAAAVEALNRAIA